MLVLNMAPFLTASIAALNSVSPEKAELISSDVELDFNA